MTGIVVGSYRQCHGGHGNLRKNRFLMSSVLRALQAAVLIMILILTANITSAVEVDTRVVTAKSKIAKGGLRAGASVDTIRNNIDTSSSVSFQSTSKTLVTDAQATIASITKEKLPIDGDGELPTASNALLAPGSNLKSSSKHPGLDIEDEDEPKSASEPQGKSPSEAESLLLPELEPAQPLRQKSLRASEHLPLVYSNSSNHNPRARTALLRGHSAINISDSLQTEARAGDWKKAIKTIMLSTGMHASCLSSMVRYLCY